MTLSTAREFYIAINLEAAVKEKSLCFMNDTSLSKGLQLTTWIEQKPSIGKSGHNDQRYVYRNKDEVLNTKNTVSTVKHGVGSIMVWVYFAASGT